MEKQVNVSDNGLGKIAFTARKLMGLSLQDVADLAESTTSTVRSFETQERSIYLINAIRILNTLGYNLMAIPKGQTVICAPKGDIHELTVISCPHEGGINKPTREEYILLKVIGKDFKVMSETKSSLLPIE